MIRSGQMQRAEALRVLREEPVKPDPELVEYCIRKLGLSRQQWEGILADPPKSFRDYPTYYPLMRALRGPLTMAYRMGLVSPILYHKFLG